ncbi:MAG TPA: outer membrane protein assembly factor BamD, partial [Alphaproteobacteria bacterium]|nr:outer membrane protein assembly factor BamD [Alphaproteobacteria bacterium]
MKTLPRLMLAAALLSSAACSSTEEDTYVERPVEQIYNSAVDALTQERYVAAAKEFDEVDRQHPYSVWATKAQLMSAYAHYQNNR